MTNSMYSFWWDVTNDWGLNLLKISPAEDPQERPSRLRRLILAQAHTSPPDVHELRDLRGSSGPTASNLHHPVPLLRPILLLPQFVYLGVVLLNLVLRLTWLMKPLGFLKVESHAGVANFYLQMGELLRRWLWVFIRVEWETIKKGCEGQTRHRNEDEESEYELIAPHSPGIS